MQNQNLQHLRNQLKQKLFRPFDEHSPSKTTAKSKAKHEFQDQEEESKQQESSSTERRSSVNSKKNVKFEDNYQIGETIGEGAHAVVKQCYKLESLTQTPYAVKIFRSGDPEIINTIKTTFNNNKVLGIHRNICQAYELYIDEQSEQIHYLQEYCPWPSLEAVIQQRKTLSYKETQFIIRELVETLVYCHQNGVAHRDIKPDNILINLNEKLQILNFRHHRQWGIKLIDFGVSKEFHSAKKKLSRDMWTHTGTLFYQAPEIFLGGGYTEKVDVWSTGVILYQMIFGRLPFQASTIMDTIELIQEANLDLTHVEKLPKILQDLLRRILHKNPSQRLGTTEMLLHPWLKKDNEDLSRTTKDDVDLQARNYMNESDDVRKSTPFSFKNMTPDMHSIKTSQKSKSIYNFKEVVEGLRQDHECIYVTRKEQPQVGSRFRAYSYNHGKAKKKEITLITYVRSETITSPNKSKKSNSSVSSIANSPGL